MTRLVSLLRAPQSKALVRASVARPTLSRSHRFREELHLRLCVLVEDCAVPGQPVERFSTAVKWQEGPCPLARPRIAQLRGLAANGTRPILFGGKLAKQGKEYI
jgi:hypothetical protein